MSLVERPITVKIRDNSTGEIVDHADTGSFEDGEFQDFLWSEGNYACDCNRTLFFYRAKGLDDPDDEQCGEEAYSIQIICDGTIVYDEF